MAQQGLKSEIGPPHDERHGLVGAPTTNRRRVLSPRNWSLATQLFAVQADDLLIVLVGAGLAALSNASTANSDSAQEEVFGSPTLAAAAPHSAGRAARRRTSACSNRWQSRSAGKPRPISWSS